jgi:hypothetical protein
MAFDDRQDREPLHHIEVRQPGVQLPDGLHAGRVPAGGVPARQRRRSGRCDDEAPSPRHATTLSSIADAGARVGGQRPRIHASRVGDLMTMR